MTLFFCFCRAYTLRKQAHSITSGKMDEKPLSAYQIHSLFQPFEFIYLIWFGSSTVDPCNTFIFFICCIWLFEIEIRSRMQNKLESSKSIKDRNKIRFIISILRTHQKRSIEQKSVIYWHTIQLRQQIVGRNTCQILVFHFSGFPILFMLLLHSQWFEGAINSKCHILYLYC